MFAAVSVRIAPGIGDIVLHKPKRVYSGLKGATRERPSPKERPIFCDTVADMIRVLLPCGGYAMIEAQAYFDESGSHNGSRILCVAGYIFRKSEAIKLGHEWRKVLRWKKLPYFHMVDCAHGNGPFANLTKPERIEVQTKLIEAIKKYAIQGIAVTVDPIEYATFQKRLPFEPWLYENAYSFCAQAIMTGVSVFIEKNPAVGSMAYFFEAGHKSRPQAHEIMQRMFAQQRLKDQFRYVGHAFVEKAKSPAVQAADLLAWQWYTDRRHEREGRPRRRDCASLLQQHHNVVHVNSKELDRIAKDAINVVSAFRAQSS
jgi:hypothetical protein